MHSGHQNWPQISMSAFVMLVKRTEERQSDSLWGWLSVCCLSLVDVEQTHPPPLPFSIWRRLKLVASITASQIWHLQEDAWSLSKIGGGITIQIHSLISFFVHLFIHPLVYSCTQPIHGWHDLMTFVASSHNQADVIPLQASSSHFPSRRTNTMQIGGLERRGRQ